MSPSTAEEWLDVARSRSADAGALRRRGSRSTGPVYMAGYAIECTLKALLQARGSGFPKSGAGGHDLRGLWAAAGLQLRDLDDPTGDKAYYLQRWSTDLRYETRLTEGLDGEALVGKAAELTGWILKQVKREQSQRKRRRSL